MVAGDTCIIRGGTYRETVVVPNSGNALAPITFKPYGTEIVTISGADPLTGWVSKGGNIYEMQRSAPLFQDNGYTQLFKSGKMIPEARWPNAISAYPWPRTDTGISAAYSYVDEAGYDANDLNGWVKDLELPSRPSGYWVGAKMHIMSGYVWNPMNHANVTGYNDSTKVLQTDDANGYSYAAKFYGGNVNFYYLTGKKQEMDSDGEWFYDPASSIVSIYSSSGVPAGIEGKARAYGFDLSGKSYININKINFFGCTIKTTSASASCRLDGLNMKYLGHSETDATVTGVVLRNGFVLCNSDLGWDSKSLIYLGGSDIRVFNNHLHDCSYVPSKREIIRGDSSGMRNLVSHNTMHDAGSGAIGGLGKQAILEYNSIYNAVRLVVDCGTMYIVNFPSENMIIRYNVLHDGYGPVGVKGAANHGFYVDNCGSGYVFYKNLVYNMPNMAMMLNCRENYDLVFNNTLYGDRGGITCGFFAGPENRDGPNSGVKLFNNIMKGIPQNPRGDGWAACDVRFNCPDDPHFVDAASGNFQIQSDSAARDKGTLIPGVTDGFAGSAPDIGALEYGATDWRNNIGYKTTPLSSEPTYQAPDLIFINKIKESSFETGLIAPNWQVNSTTITNAATPWRASFVRIGSKSLKATAGDGELKQTVTGLLPNRAYRAYGAIQNGSSSTTAKLGIRNYGGSALETPARIQTLSNYWDFVSIPFITGTNATSAELYAKVSIPAGSSDVVYLDDFGVELCPDADPQPVPMPYVHYTLNEGSGNIVKDNTTNSSGKDGTLTGSTLPSFVSGVEGKGLKFNSNCVTTAALTIPVKEMTIACWAKSPTTTWNSEQSFVTQIPGFAFGGKKGSANLSFYWNYSSGSPIDGISFTAPTNFDITAWHHYAVSYSVSSKSKMFFVDGIPFGISGIKTNSVANISGSTAPILLGKNNSYHQFNGYLDDVRIYHKALNEQELKSLYNLYSSDQTKNLALRLKLDDGAGSNKAWDSSLYVRNGTLNGMDATTSWVTGRLGKALTFNGTSAFVSTPTFPTPSSVSVSCFAKSGPSLWNASDCLVSKAPGFILSSVKGTKNVSFTVVVGGAARTITFNAPGSFNLAAWHEYSGTYSSSTGTLKIYVDGILQNALSGNPGAADATSSAVLLGRDNSGSNFLNGQIDEVEINGRELSADEILRISLMTYGPYEAPPIAGPAANIPPTANAGSDKSITLPTSSVSLNGSGSDPDGTITSYTWSQVSGPSSAVFSSTSSAATAVSALIQGSYTFRLKITDDAGGSGTDDVVVAVNPPANVAPTASAGTDQSITLPTNSTTLAGSGSDSDGSIASYAWSQVSGPSSATIGSVTSASTAIGSLVQGSYTFRLKITDNAGASATDDVVVTVYPAANIPPSANAGADKSITLPTNSVTLSGSGSDSDGTIASYSWSQISGPSTALLGNSTSASTTAGSLIQGSYTFRLKVTDNAGASASDDVVVAVNASQSVVSFTLINADTEADIGTLKNGDTLNLATLPTRQLNIRANTNPSVVGSVNFSLTGAETRMRTENSVPYAIFDNSPTNYVGFTPLVGADTLTATPYSGSKLTGIQGTPLTVNFTVIDQAPPVVTSSLTATATQNKSFSYQITASNSPQSYNATGLPAGVTVNKTTGLVSGTPTVSGSFNVTISAMNIGGSSSKTLVLTINKPQALFVVGNTTLGTGDAAVKSRLESLGFVVTIKSAITSAPADATGKQLVVISSTGNSVDSNTKFRDVAVPLLTWESYLFDDLGMTGPIKGTNYEKKASQSTISVINTTHKMAAGLSGTQTVYLTAGFLDFGQPGSAAVNIATVSGDATKSVIFGYDQGAQMFGLVAPARRVGFFLYDTEASTMTSPGWALFDSAVMWALN